MSAAPEAVRVCASDALTDGGAGVRVDATLRGEQAVVFFVRYDGRAYGYLNRCAHVPMELDWAEGQFFESSGLYLMCATHGAIYAPDTGKCVGGPCRGGRLRPVEVDERDTPDGRAVFWVPDADLGPAAPPPPATTD
ncbi:Rieske (2Fe-2S) protein [Burkholderia sp. Bp9031]|uniref:Rieske (2Fe-2S) protein n=1 Tax=Burkholderia sp. Bp9031 TaxID=2184566 RepID=UPI0007167560|nr:MULTISPECIES: Rieske 2Fe-2S domain-containing protein [Burkholderia]RQZ10708.1 Rieske (2Fe-2S) protein [Burkholderia sp. Bp9031]